jgi:L-ascorbate metabolism protein UlaG (beta-lactamase superfamily)
MRIKFYAHASFRLESDQLAVVTDPYTPAPGNSGFDRIEEPADIVIMSSATDSFHSDPSHVLGNPTVVNALELPQEGKTVGPLYIKSYPAYESMTFDYRAAYNRDPDANALYHFEIGGLRVLHMGDTGVPVLTEYLDALAGAHATIALDKLDEAIKAIKPKAVIPMHYYSPKGVLKIEPVEKFLAYYSPENVTRVKGSTLELTPATLPKTGPHIYVLEQSK